MNSSFDFLQNSIIPGQENIQVEQTKELETIEKEPEKPAIKPLFTVIPDDAEPTMQLTLADTSTVLEPVKKRHSRKKKTEPDNISTPLVRAEHAEGVVEDAPTMYTYSETTAMTRDTIAQLDFLASVVKDDLDLVQSSKTLKRRNDYIIGLSSNLAQILNTKLTAIREINSSISKSNELDYKKSKDMRAMDNAQNDDKYLMDMYNAFISNTGSVQGALGPSLINATVTGTPIVRATTNNDGMMDTGYLNYISNMTPEQKMMRLEQDPNIKQVVVYDASNGNKFFQVMNIATGEVINGVPVRDQMFMEDTTLDLRNKIARNTNLNETYPLIVINDNIASEY